MNYDTQLGGRHAGGNSDNRNAPTGAGRRCCAQAHRDHRRRDSRRAAGYGRTHPPLYGISYRQLCRLGPEDPHNAGFDALWRYQPAAPGRLTHGSARAADLCQRAGLFGPICARRFGTSVSEGQRRQRGQPDLCTGKRSPQAAHRRHQPQQSRSLVEQRQAARLWFEQAHRAVQRHLPDEPGPSRKRPNAGGFDGRRLVSDRFFAR